MIRQEAIESARSLSQQLWEEAFRCGRRAYYVERDGKITRDEYVGNFYERQSVYFGHDDCATRIADTGLGSVGYSGDEERYREMVPAEDAAGLPAGKHHGDYNDGLGVYWIKGQGWSRPGDICHWRERDVDDPSDPLVAAIEALPAGFFADEAADVAA